jgi:hypothetical protein
MLRRTALLTFGSLLALFAAGAQPQAPREPPKQQAPASSASQPPTFGQNLRKSVGFLTVKYLKDGAGMQSSGTCFFVFYEDKRLGENQGFRYLVTNRHMTSPGVEKGESYSIQQASVRLNLRNPDAGKESEEATSHLEEVCIGFSQTTSGSPMFVNVGGLRGHVMKSSNYLLLPRPDDFRRTTLERIPMAWAAPDVNRDPKKTQ